MTFTVTTATTKPTKLTKVGTTTTIINLGTRVDCDWRSKIFTLDVVWYPTLCSKTCVHVWDRRQTGNLGNTF